MRSLVSNRDARIRHTVAYRQISRSAMTIRAREQRRVERTRPSFLLILPRDISPKIYVFKIEIANSETRVPFDIHIHTDM